MTNDEASIISSMFGWVPGIVSLLMSFGTAIYFIAVVASQVSQNTQQIAELKTASRESEADRRTTDTRLSRMEAKLDMLLESMGLNRGPRR